MRKIHINILKLVICSIIIQINAYAMTLKTGISLSDQVPSGFFGSWEITSTMQYSNNPSIFNEKSVDYWNLSKRGDVITLSNPLSGAEASVTVEEVNGNKITFTHSTKNKTAKMTEKPTLTLNGENFSGTDKIILEKFNYGEKISEDVVVYKITAKKLSGDSALTIFTSKK